MPQVSLTNHYQYSVFEELWILLCPFWTTDFHEKPMRLFSQKNCFVSGFIKLLSSLSAFCASGMEELVFILDCLTHLLILRPSAGSLARAAFASSFIAENGILGLVSSCQFLWRMHFKLLLLKTEIKEKTSPLSLSSNRRAEKDKLSCFALGLLFQRLQIWVTC